jgi:hypothetical protein
MKHKVDRVIILKEVFFSTYTPGIQRSSFHVLNMMLLRGGIKT